jgi:phosphoribosyl isomerase A
MFVIPALQLDADPNRAYAGSLAESLREWEGVGFRRVQLVLGGRDRLGVDTRLLEVALRDAHCPTQVSGPIESGDDVEAILGTGADFAVLGSRAIEDSDWAASVISRFAGQLIVSTPARERRLRSRGAVRTRSLDLRDVVAELSGLPLGGLVVEFAPDAEMNHVDLALVEDVVEEAEYPVLVAGGVLTLAALRDLEFRGASAVIMPAAHLSAEFDGQTLARNFSD